MQVVGMLDNFFFLTHILILKCGPLYVRDETVIFWFVFVFLTGVCLQLNKTKPRRGSTGLTDC